LSTERTTSISSTTGGTGDRRSTALDTSIGLMRKRESAGGGQTLGLPQGEGAKEDGVVLNNSFRPVTLTVQSFFKQVCVCFVTVYTACMPHVSEDVFFCIVGE